MPPVYPRPYGRGISPACGREAHTSKCPLGKGISGTRFAYTNMTKPHGIDCCCGSKIRIFCSLKIFLHIFCPVRECFKENDVYWCVSPRLCRGDTLKSASAEADSSSKKTPLVSHAEYPVGLPRDKDARRVLYCGKLLLLFKSVAVKASMRA